jgi:DNA-binding transcriptional regulator YdaS (Cro superfamily)
MDIKTYCQQNRGAQAHIAKCLGIEASRVNQWVQGSRSIPAIWAVKIELATDGAVMRWTMRADWADLWPDLVQRVDAPAVEASSHAA